MTKVKILRLLSLALNLKPQLCRWIGCSVHRDFTFSNESKDFENTKERMDGTTSSLDLADAIGSFSSILVDN